MSDLLPLALALNPEESLKEELVHIKKELDDLHGRVGTSLFIEKILPKLLPGLHFSHDQRGYHNTSKQTTMSDLVPALSAVIKEKSLVDAKEELADLYKIVDTADSIEIVHEATNIENDIVVYASAKLEDGDFVGHPGNPLAAGDPDNLPDPNRFWEVPLNNNKSPTTCKLKDLAKCHICVGGGFAIQSLTHAKYCFLQKRDDGIYCTMFFRAKFFVCVSIVIDVSPQEPWLQDLGLFRASERAGPTYTVHNNFRETLANIFPEATVQITFVSFESKDIQAPLQRVKDIEELLPEASSRSSLSQTTTMSDLLPEKSLLDTKEEFDCLYKRVETATSIEVMQVNKWGDIVACASGKFENGHFDDCPWKIDCRFAGCGWVVPLSNDKMPTCKLKDLWKCHLCIGGGFKYRKLIADNSLCELYRREDGRLECCILFDFEDSPLEFTMTIYGWPTAEDTWPLECALTPIEDPDGNYGEGGTEVIGFFRKTVAKNYPEATVRFDLVSFEAKAIQGPLRRIVTKHRKHKVLEELKESDAKPWYEEGRKQFLERLFFTE